MGARLSQHLSLSHDVHVTTRKPLANFKKTIVGDATDSSFFAKLASQSFDAVVYTVSLNHSESNQDIERTIEVNVNSTGKCLEAFSKSQAKRFIYFSTQQVYGPFTAGFDFNEDSACNPNNIYGLTHLMSESLCNYYFNNTKLKSIAVRLSNSVGAPIISSPHISSLVALDLCQMCVREGVIKLKSDGTPQRDFIAMGDVCKGVETLLTIPKPNYSIYNLGSGQTITLGELAVQIARIYENLSGKKTKILRNDGIEITSQTIFNDKRFSYSTSRLGELGFRAKTSIEAALTEILKGV